MTSAMIGAMSEKFKSGFKRSVGGLQNRIRSIGQRLISG